MMNSNTLLDRPQEAWQPYEPSNEEPWDARRVAHLHRRAGFGASWELISRDLHAGPAAAIRRVLEGDERGPDGRPAADFEAVATAMDRSFDQQASLGRLQLLWLYRIFYSPFPLLEKMTLAWHAHFATAFEKTGARLLAEQNRAQRELWRAPISQLHLRMLRDPALLVWLDGVNSNKGQPNENLGREFLELFALGEGNYTEQDVKETARALTGWQRMADRDELLMLPSRHDAEPKTILGQTGAWGDEEVVHIACQQPAAARHIARRLWRTFIADTIQPSAELIEELAAAMRVPGDVDVARGIEIVLRSRLFHSVECRGWRVASPVELVACTLRSCEMLTPCPDLMEVNLQLGRMGQLLFQPPSVAGWPGGLEWLRGPTIVARTNFGAWLVDGSSGVGPDHFLALALRYGWTQPTERLERFALLTAPVPLPDERAAAITASTSAIDDPAKSCAAMVRQVLSSPEAQLC
jgi:uncharacterized protein (DUF1800 family)